MTKIKLSTLLTLLLGITIGFGVTSFLKGCNSDDFMVIKPATDKSTELEKQIAVTESANQYKMDSLEQHNAVLETSLKEITATLTSTKKKNLVLQTQIYDLIDRRGEAKAKQETGTILSVCDSLEKKTKELIVTGEEKDSLCNTITDNLSVQLKNKDSTIAIEKESYQQLKLGFQLSVAAQDVLEKENKYYRKKLKGQKRRSRLVSAAILIVSGFTANYLLHH